MNREQLEKKFENRIVTRTFEKYDVSVSIRPLSAWERAQSIDRQRMVAKSGKDDNDDSTQIEMTLKNVACFVICRGLVDDETHERLYSDEEVERIITIYPGDLLEFISSEILKISGIEMSREEASKNSSPAPIENSSSD